MQIHRMTNEEFEMWESGQMPELPWICKMEENKCTRDNPCDGCWGFLR